MEVSVTFNVGDGGRKALAWYIDRKQWDGKRKATRDEIAGYYATKPKKHTWMCSINSRFSASRGDKIQSTEESRADLQQSQIAGNPVALLSV